MRRPSSCTLTKKTKQNKTAKKAHAKSEPNVKTRRKQIVTGRKRSSEDGGKNGRKRRVTELKQEEVEHAKIIIKTKKREKESISIFPPGGRLGNKSDSSKETHP